MKNLPRFCHGCGRELKTGGFYEERRNGFDTKTGQTLGSKFYQIVTVECPVRDKDTQFPRWQHTYDFREVVINEREIPTHFRPWVILV